MSRNYQYVKNYTLLIPTYKDNIVKTCRLNDNKNKYSSLIGKKGKFTKGVYKGYGISSKKIE